MRKSVEKKDRLDRYRSVTLTPLTSALMRSFNTYVKPGKPNAKNAPSAQPTVAPSKPAAFSIRIETLA